METTFKHLLQTRKNILRVLEANSENMFNIPNGFNNSLYWNAAHCVVTMQLLCYKLTGNKMYTDNEVVEAYRKGAKATGVPANIIEVGKIKDLLITSVEQLEKDYKAGLLKNFAPYETSFGVTLESIEETIQFQVVHEGLHLGYMMAMKNCF